MVSSQKLIILMAFVFPGKLLLAQDSQSIADVARQSRQQKQQQEAQPPADSQSTPTSGTTSPKPKSTHVFTNDEIPEQTGTPAARKVKAPKESSTLPNYKDGKHTAEYWKSHILQMKNSISSQQKRIDSTVAAIRFAGGNYELHEAWNARQRQKLQQVDSMKSDLADLKKRLDDMQESARHEGYTSLVYDP